VREGERESRVEGRGRLQSRGVRQETKDKPVVKKRGKNCSQISKK